MTGNDVMIIAGGLVVLGLALYGAFCALRAWSGLWSAGRQVVACLAVGTMLIAVGYLGFGGGVGAGPEPINGDPVPGLTYAGFGLVGLAAVGLVTLVLRKWIRERRGKAVAS